MINKFLSSIDVYDKLSAEEYRVKTSSGGELSLLLSLVGSFLFFIQFFYFLSPDVTRELTINRNLTNNLDLVNISLSLAIKQPCYFLSIGNMDSLGINKFYNSTLRFIRVNKNGIRLGLANSTQILNLKLSGKNNKRISQPEYLNTCHSCYGIRGDTECCNSCEELYLLHLKKNKVPHPEQWEQCKNVSLSHLHSLSLDELCLIKGKLTVNKVPGNINIVYGSRSARNSYKSGIYMQTTAVDEFPSVDLSHAFERLRFGPNFLTISRPLDHSSVFKHEKGNLKSFKYDIVATPVVCIANDNLLGRTFEYNVMSTTLPVTPENKLVPGIYFYYQFAPFSITVNARSKSFSQFIGMTFGILAGAYAITSLIDSLLYKAVGAKETILKEEDE